MRRCTLLVEWAGCWRSARLFARPLLRRCQAEEYSAAAEHQQPGRRSGAAEGSAAHAYAAQAYAAQDAERQRQHLQQLDLRQQQALHRLGAGGGAYDRLSAAGMPLP